MFPLRCEGIINTDGEKDYSLRLLKEVEAIKNDQKFIIFNKIYSSNNN